MRSLQAGFLFGLPHGEGAITGRVRGDKVDQQLAFETLGKLVLPLGVGPFGRRIRRSIALPVIQAAYELRRGPRSAGIAAK